MGRQARQTKVRNHEPRELARVVHQNVPEVEVIVAELGILAVNLVERRNNLENHRGHILVTNTRLNLGEPVVKVATRTVL